MRRFREQSAFTLVEVLVATMVTVLVAGSTVAIVRSSVASRERARRQMNLQQEIRSALNIVATTLRNAYRAGGEQRMLAGMNDEVDLRPADRLRFFAISHRRVRSGQPESDVKEFEFSLMETDGMELPVLVRRSDPTWNEVPDEGGVLEHIARGVVRFDVVYYDGVEWQEDWDSRDDGWPVAIRVIIGVASKEKPEHVWEASRLVSFPHLVKTEAGGEE